tara:strand:- start:773 stop:1303 length:531 start_codon:yes stop_codon:yes gene_type:complete
MSILTIPALIDQINTDINTNGIKSVTGTLLNANLIDMVDSLNSLTPYTSVSVTLTQAEVATLNSANGGYGYEILPAPGAGMVYQVVNPMIIFKEDSGSTYEAGVTSIYPTDSNFNLYAITRVYNRAVGSQKRFYQLPLIGDGLTEENNAMWLYNSVESPLYFGSAILSFDYKIISV